MAQKIFPSPNSPKDEYFSPQLTTNRSKDALEPIFDFKIRASDSNELN